MAVTRKPQVLPERDIAALIAKGGSSAAATPTSTDVKLVPIRMEATLLARLDQAVQAQPIRIPRNTWVLHAIVEKLTRDGF